MTFSVIAFQRGLVFFQTELETHDEFRNMEWSALDFSTDPPVYRHFIAKFEKVNPLL